MSQRIFKRGFTLLELLVVMAIIGVFASIVFYALTDARNKGSDGAVKSNLASARSQAETFFNVNTADPGTYTDVCTNGVVGGALGIGVNILSAGKAVGISNYSINNTPNPGVNPALRCNSSASAWAAEVPLKKSGFYWCVDSALRSLERNTSIGASGTACN